MEVISAITLGLSFPAAVLCLLVIRHWLPEAIRVLKGPLEAADWLVLGVTLGFIGIFLNLLYWMIWWLVALHYGDFSPWHYPAGRWGTAVNLGTLLLIHIASAWCHLHAYYLFSQEKVTHPSRVIHVTTIFAVVLISLILLLREILVNFT